ncbi:protein phosphatase 2C domain-containing protein [Okeanomitos corallinicola TIOX110]|uniref:Protein phosphatase 2C domain-containing protein n=1 Tax=Okeanomitos corallinicola TIOX110 TaxID=3133117 RepID=A0ABZ2UTV2_9CYAN
MQWQAVAKSVIGTKHIKSETPCQDYSSYKIVDQGQVIVGAVSDGMGSAKHSEKGSRLAVETTIKYLINQQNWKYKLDENSWKESFKKLLIEVRNQLDNHAKKYQFNINELDCTLITFVATPKFIAAMQVGDGLIVVRANDQDYELLFQPDKGQYANETTPVTDTAAIREMRFCLKNKGYDFICAATDGIENLALDKKTPKWKPFDNFFKMGLEPSIFSNQSLQDKEIDVEDFLNSKKMNQNTDDDKTLLLCAYSNFLEAREFPDRDTIPNPQPDPISDEEDDITPSPNPNNQDEDIKHFINFIKAELTSIPEAEGIKPIINISKGSLEIIFKSSRPLQYFETLVQKIQEREIVTDKKYIKSLQEVTVYDQEMDGYIRKKARITISAISSDSIIYIVGGVLILSLIAGIVFSFNQFKSNEKPPSNPKTSPPNTQPSTSSKEETNPKPKNSSSPLTTPYNSPENKEQKLQNTPSPKNTTTPTTSRLRS